MDNNEVIAIGSFRHYVGGDESTGTATRTTWGLLSSNGGETFGAFLNPAGLPAGYNGNASLRSGAYLGNGIVIAANADSVFRSTDYGRTFVEITHLFTGLNSLGFRNFVKSWAPGKALVGGSIGRSVLGVDLTAPAVWRTLDGGLTWTRTTAFEASPMFQGGNQFSEDHRVFAVGVMPAGTGLVPIQPTDSVPDDPPGLCLPGDDLEPERPLEVRVVVAPNIAAAGLLVHEGFLSPAGRSAATLPYRVSADLGQTFNVPLAPMGRNFQCQPVPSLESTSSILISPDVWPIEIHGTDDFALLGLNTYQVPLTLEAIGADIWLGTLEHLTGNAALLASGRCLRARVNDEEHPCMTPPRVSDRPLSQCDYDITDTDLIGARWVAGDRFVINQVIFSLDWDWFTQRFTKHVIYTFDASVDKYGLRPAMRIESRGLKSPEFDPECYPFPPPCLLQGLDERVLSIAERFTDPPAMLEVQIFYRNHHVEVGDVVCLTSEWVPNLVTGERGIDGEAFEVIACATSPPPEARVTMTLLDIKAVGDPTFLRFSPQEDIKAALTRSNAMTDAEKAALRRRMLTFTRTQRQANVMLAPPGGLP